MATALDMSLNDLIKSKKYSERGRGQGRRWGRGLTGWRGGSTGGRGIGRGRQALRVSTQPSSYKISKASVKSIASFNRAKEMIQRHGLFDESMKAAGLTGVESGTKLYISNLDYGVSNEDIKELFSEIGALKRSAVHYGRNGRSIGSAEVVFTRRSDAVAALKRYNNVQLDGKPMKIEVVGTNLGLPVTPRVNVVGGANGRGMRTVVMTPEFGRGGTRAFNRISRRSRGRGFDRGSGRGQGQVRGRGGRVQGRKKPVEKSAHQLDKELETYHAEAMNTS